MGRPPSIPAETKSRMVMSVIAGELTIAEAARKEKVSEQSIGRWKADFLEAGKTALAAGKSGPSTREQQLEAEVAELTLALGESAVEIRVWKKSAEGRLGSADAGPASPSVEQYRRGTLTRLQAAHVLLFHNGQVTRPPLDARRDAGDWTRRLVPVPAPPAVTAVVERYLRLRLEANLDRPQTVRHARDALRRLLVWLAEAHPELTNLAQLRREHA